jgi:hypothetical protein
MEIGDFYKESRRIVFNLDKKRDYYKAIRTLTPKGLKKRRKRKNKSNQKFIQRTITETLNSFLKIDIPKNKTHENLQTKKKVENKNRIIIEDHIIQEFGTSGNLEVICPFCQDIINFEYFNLEEKKKRATRICSCDAIARISTRAFNKKLFSDLGIQNEFFNEFVQKIENELQDEFGNPIFTYAFRNDQNLLKD